jgi:hypothetical protein
MFPTHFCQFFKKTTIKDNRDFSLKDLVVEFCLIFDILYAKSGTEAVAKSFYRVVDKQEMEG